MYFIVYQTTNKLTGEVYIGKHKTNSLDDGYLGSGKRFINNLKKYGKENFERKILYFCNSDEEAHEKEQELVTEEFIKQDNSLNLIVGGGGLGFKNTTIVSEKSTGTIKRISCKEYNSNKDIYEHISANTVLVLDEEIGKYKRISVDEYDPDVHITPSSSKVSVFDKITNKTKSINIGEYDPDIHEKVFGGIVANVDGVNQYVDKSTFQEMGLSGIHVGKITVLEKSTGIIKHIDNNEFKSNRHLYKTLTEGMIRVTNKNTNESYMVSREELSKLDKNEFKIGTEGTVTVFDTLTSTYGNIPTKEFDSIRYKLAVYKRFEIYKSDGTFVEEFWQSKQDFFEKYNGPISLWNSLSKGNVFKWQRGRGKEFDGWYSIIIPVK